MGSAAADIGEVPKPVALSADQVSARRWQLHALAAFVIVTDQLTKWWATNALADGEEITGPLGSGLRLVYNTGSAFSFGAGFGAVFGVVALIVAVAIFWIVRRVEHRLVVTGLALVQGGAVGNVLDRFFRDGDGFLSGAVIDFIEVGDWWPVFNVADAAIVVGGFLVVLFGSRE